MWRLALDQNFNLDIFNAVRMKHDTSDLDVVRLFDVGLREAPDEVVLEWAAQEHRIIITHDVKTMVPLANAIDGFAYLLTLRYQLIWGVGRHA